METELSANVVIGYLIVSAIQWAKKQHWIPMIDFDSARANRVVAALAALAGSLGIHATYNSAEGSLLITGLSLGTMLPMAGEWLRQFIVQQLIYKGAGFDAESTKLAAGGGVDPKRFAAGPGGLAAWFLPILLVGGLAAGCASGGPAPVTMVPSHEQVQATRAKAVEIANAVESIGHLVTEAGRATDAAYKSGLVPRDVADQVDRAIVALKPRANDLIDIAATVTTDPQLKSTVQALMTIVDDLLAQLDAGNEAMRAVSVSIRTALAVASTYLGGGR